MPVTCHEAVTWQGPAQGLQKLRLSAGWPASGCRMLLSFKAIRMEEVGGTLEFRNEDVY